VFIKLSNIFGDNQNMYKITIKNVMNKEIITFIKYRYFIKLNFNRRVAN